MLNNASGFRKVYIAAGYTDLRRGIDGLASIVKFNFQLDPYEKDILFLFCGRRSDRIKGLVWEGDGFLLLYKRLEPDGFSWPRTKEEALEITPEQYRALMQGLEIISSHPVSYTHLIHCRAKTGESSAGGIQRTVGADSAGAGSQRKRRNKTQGIFPLGSEVQICGNADQRAGTDICREGSGI